tara:strand:- start:861 stop:1484 length:624 start_codon:yes stop_codon:yes gene_type:complete
VRNAVFVLVFFWVMGTFISFGTVLSTKLSVNRPINDRVSVVLDTRWDYDKTQSRYYHAGAGLSQSLADDWVGGVFYRVITKRSSAQWTDEHRPYGQLEKRLRGPWVDVRVRYRAEYRLRDSEDNTVRNRARLMVRAASTWTQFLPFVSNEWFFSEDEYSKNWFIIGSRLPNIGQVSPSVYYKNVATKDSNGICWKEPVHTITMSLRF